MTEIRTKPATPEYRDNWDRIFGREVECAVCGRTFTTRWIALGAPEKQPCNECLRDTVSP